MTDRAVRTGPRIYNLFPLLCGPISSWRCLLPRIAATGFDWIYINPFHYPGFSGSLYAVKDYYRLNPLIRGKARRDDAALLAEFVAAAKKRGLAVMMDLVVNHTAKDSLLAEQHPEWFAHEPDGSIRSPHAIDPADATKVTVWGDLGEIDYAREHARAAITAYWRDVVRHYLGLGFAGFRCDAAYKVPTEVWAPLIAEARRISPEAHWFAETLGCRIEQVKALAGAGFDFLFNSVKWWDLEAPWALEQYEMFRHIAPSVGFPESHDTERVAAELAADTREPAAARKWLLLRYALAAFFATGILMPVGYEYGFRRRLDVVRTRPTDWEEPWFDLSRDIAAINRLKAACPALNEEGPQLRLPGIGGSVALLRRTVDGSSASVFLANPRGSGPVHFDLVPSLRDVAVPMSAFRDVTPGAPPRNDPLTGDLAPIEWRLLQTA